jgi:hypothetical protein
LKEKQTLPYHFYDTNDEGLDLDDDVSQEEDEVGLLAVHFTAAELLSDERRESMRKEAKQNKNKSSKN